MKKSFRDVEEPNLFSRVYPRYRSRRIAYAPQPVDYVAYGQTCGSIIGPASRSPSVSQLFDAATVASVAITSVIHLFACVNALRRTRLIQLKSNAPDSSSETRT